MCNILQVQWTIVPQVAPQPWIVCNGCGGPNPFKSSGKLRLNANGKKLDAWLIYRCSTCDKTWNRVIFERRSIREIDPATLEALQSNDPDWVRSRAFDIDALRGKSRRIDEFADIDIRKAVLCSAQDWVTLEIVMKVPLAAAIRLDRLLATELEISRSRLQALCGKGKLRTDPVRKDMLRRRPKDGLRVVLDLSGETDRQSVGLFASGMSSA
ncbi:MAG: DUF1062 domain-containing protein [Shinella sp.]|nr:DUF1062 domain-containing protein [Shinella sp.]